MQKRIELKALFSVRILAKWLLVEVSILSRDFFDIYISSAFNFFIGGSEALKKIYYGILKKFKAGNIMSGKMLTKIVKNCLVMANLDKISSISIPLLGTAGLGNFCEYPWNLAFNT